MGSAILGEKVETKQYPNLSRIKGVVGVFYQLSFDEVGFSAMKIRNRRCGSYRKQTGIHANSFVGISGLLLWFALQCAMAA